MQFNSLVDSRLVEIDSHNFSCQIDHNNRRLICSQPSPNGIRSGISFSCYTTPWSIFVGLWSGVCYWFPGNLSLKELIQHLFSNLPDGVTPTSIPQSSLTILGGVDAIVLVARKKDGTAWCHADRRLLEANIPNAIAKTPHEWCVASNVASISLAMATPNQVLDIRFLQTDEQFELQVVVAGCTQESTLLEIFTEETAASLYLDEEGDDLFVNTPEESSE